MNTETSGASVRPDPDKLLAQIALEAATALRGRLRIFFGASAGVGKTYAMLESARHAQAAGIDIAVGYVEPHGRTETDRLLIGLEQLPTLPVRYRGIIRQEFDLDAAIRRHPHTLLVDELAHSNPVDGDPPARHEKRWQDVEELLAAGINVWTTVNVQHLESLNDVVTRATGIRQQETIPDHVLEAADEVELIDLPPEDLLERLRAGKVYEAERVATALQRFFRKENLTALREIALRKTADRVDAAMQRLQEQSTATRLQSARDRLIVAPGIDDQAEQVVRAGKRLADALDAVWTVLSIETPSMTRLSESLRNRRVQVLRLAESLGAETVTLDGENAADAILEYARTRNVTRIVVGAPKRRGWRAWMTPSTVNQLTRGAGGIDVISVGPVGQPEARATRETWQQRSVDTIAPPKGIAWRRYALALGTCVVVTGVDWLMFPHLALTNLVMVYLLGAAICGLLFGRGPAIAASVVNVLAFDFFFVPPRFTMEVDDLQYLPTFAIMLIVAFSIGTLTASVRRQTRLAGHRERRTAALYAMSRELSRTRSMEAMATVSVHHIEEVFASQAVVLLPGVDGHLECPPSAQLPSDRWQADLSIAEWVFHHNQPAGLGTNTLAGTKALYLPLRGSAVVFGVIAVLPANARRILLPEQRSLLETFAGQLALAVERARVTEQSEVAKVTAQTESLRNTLLAAISHDLRTPLAVISGASAALNDPSITIDDQARRNLVSSIATKSREMSDLITQVLELTRLESGEIRLSVDWQTVDDLIGIALGRLESALKGYPVTVNLPPDLPALRLDGTLIAQVLINLLENVTRHAPPGTQVAISAAVIGAALEIRIDDNGPGLPSGDSERLFDKFHRGREEGTNGGAGLGLAICRAIISAHGGRIRAENGLTGGSSFIISLPVSNDGLS